MMIKFTKLACLLALCSGIAMGCGDDDEDGGGGGVEACTFEDDGTCQESGNVGLVCEGFGGTLSDSCPAADQLGKCVYKEDDGSTTTQYYYEGDNWDAESAQEDCEDDFTTGTFTAK
jgi:hypothetical protein